MRTLYFIGFLLVDDIAVADDVCELALDLLEVAFRLKPGDNLSKDDLVGLMLKFDLLVGVLQKFVVPAWSFKYL